MSYWLDNYPIAVQNLIYRMTTPYQPPAESFPEPHGADSSIVDSRELNHPQVSNRIGHVATNDLAPLAREERYIDDVRIGLASLLRPREFVRIVRDGVIVLVGREVQITSKDVATSTDSSPEA
ncbi:MAG: hypothetical protein M3Q79_03100 [bacterium]|nr:hypothetical protein [bacterium]